MYNKRMQITNVLVGFAIQILFQQEFSLFDNYTCCIETISIKFDTVDTHLPKSIK